MSAGDLLLVAGEASGDLYAARLIDELRGRRPDLKTFGLGGEEMAAAGFDAVADSAEISVVGIVEVLKIYRRAKEIFDLLLREVDRRGTRTAVLVDFPEFNLRLAEELHQRGVRVVYYISPQIWAWRRGRVKKIARLVDRMLVLFPFELEFYRGHGVRAVHVGHPLVDEVPQPETHAWGKSLGEGTPFRLALLPGSRASEVGRLLPSMLRAVEILGEELPLDLSLIEAPTVPAELFDRLLAEVSIPVRRVHRDQRFEALPQIHLALCASGTATVEVGLLGTPMIVVYRLALGSYLLGRLLVRLPHFSMVNLILGHGAVPEKIQGETNPTKLARAMAELLRDREAIEGIRGSLASLRPSLGSGGASARAAAEVLAAMDESEAAA